MNPARVFRLLALACLLPAGLFPARVSAVPAAEPASQQICADADANFRDHPEWLAELRDPVLDSADDIRERVGRYGDLYRCFSSGGIAVVGDMVEVERLLTLFMLFAGGSLFPQAQAEARNYTLTFADIQDPAVRILRDELGIPSPPGLIYIWLYPSQKDLPDALRGYVNNTSVRGLTLQTRYIVVFDEVRIGMQLEEYQRKQRSAVLSHEFVHAYVKSYLGPGRGFALPTWYDEGLAIYLSGSSDPTSVAYFDENGRQVTWAIPPKEYARYRDNFLYLEQTLGRAALLDLIRHSILENNPDFLLRGAGQISEEGLFRLAESSRIRRGLMRLGLAASILLSGGILIAAIQFTRKKRARQIWTPPLQSPILPPGGYAHALQPEHLDPSGDRLSELVYQAQRREPLEPHQAARERYYAVLALARENSRQAGDILLGALADESALVRGAAARGLGEWAARQVKTAGLEDRARVLGDLFTLLDRDPANEARWAAAEAIYQVSGEAALRPIRAAVRRWCSTGDENSSALHQSWYVQWLGRVGLPHLLVEAYPWCGQAARQAVSRRLRELPADVKAAVLMQARHSSDPALRELAEAVYGQD